ncbi:chaperonin 10-like protein [Xylariales sp. PMI_506]|nr:chaperonin 10-like protein [Xylariales sp. PMI_506]
MTITDGASGLQPAKTTMRAQQFDAKDRKVHLNEIPIPEPEPHQVLVKILCASLCHSDAMLFAPNESLAYTDAKPVTMGHEATGLVVRTGSEVTEFKEGDPVGFICAEKACFECDPCRNVHNLWCVKGEQQMAGFGCDGYFQEYAAVDARNMMILPEGISATEGAPLFCAGVTAFHAIDDLQLPAGSWVAVIGCGGLGHLGIQYARAMGYRVIGVDVAAAALEEARASGAERVFDSLADPGYAAEILRVTEGGVHAAVNFTASKRAYDAMPAIIRPTGILMAVGIPVEPISVNVFDIALGKYKLMGSNNGTCYNMRSAIEFSAKHGIKPHIEYFELEQLPEMIEKMTSHKARGRMAVKFT